MLLSCYICVVSNCCLSLYLNIAGLRQGPEEMLLVSWKVLEFFVTKRMGTLLLSASAPLPRMFRGLFGGHTGELCKSGWTDQDVVWRGNRLIQAPTDHTLDGGGFIMHIVLLRDLSRTLIVSFDMLHLVSGTSSQFRCASLTPVISILLFLHPSPRRSMNVWSGCCSGCT